MIRINLLPVRTSRRLEAVKQELILGGIGVGLLVVLCAVAFMFQSAKANELRRENSRLQTDLDNLRLIVARVDEVEKINDELRRKLSVIGNLQASKTGPVHILDELSAATPEKLYITELSETSSRIDLAGNAASNEVISQFLINLEKTSWFDDVYLISIDQAKVNDYALKSFKISARIVVPAYGAPPAKGGKDAPAPAEDAQ
ncbi:MAG: PilN domain-containing protein [Pseudomonadota bacterium]